MIVHEERPKASARAGRAAWDSIRKYLDGLRGYHYDLEEIFQARRLGELGWFFRSYSEQAQKDGSPYFRVEGFHASSGKIKAEFSSARGSWGA